MNKLKKAMLNSSFYSEKTSKVDFFETHISMVFVTDSFAYKVKKPVNFGFLNFTTLSRRKFFCMEELRLNRRLSSELYLDVLPISKKGDRFSFGSNGEIVEYAIKMKKLSQERMMDKLLAEGKVSKNDIIKITERIVDFHRKTGICYGSNPALFVKNLKKTLFENFRQAKRFVGITQSEKRYRDIKNFTLKFLEKNLPLIESRAINGFVKDCHGDFHSRNICIADKIYIYDCIEFNKRFRFIDTASEAAFFSMDLDYFDYPELAKTFEEEFIRQSKDKDAAKLLPFYKCYRAYVRGKVSSFLSEGGSTEEEKKRGKALAQTYFALAHRYATGGVKPRLILMSGIIASGKSYWARKISSWFNGKLIVSDEERKKLAGISINEKFSGDFKSGIYSEEFTDKVYDKILFNAKELLKIGENVVLDATFRKALQRRKAYNLAKEAGGEAFIVECIAGEDFIIKKLKKREMDKNVISDARLPILNKIKREFEEIKEDEGFKIVRLKTGGKKKELAGQFYETLKKSLGC